MLSSSPLPSGSSAVDSDSDIKMSCHIVFYQTPKQRDRFLDFFLYICTFENRIVYFVYKKYL